jgi:uncharacterized protein YndB with AHSA1/START domain
MTEPLITVETVIDADAAAVWDGLTRKKSAMFLDADVETDWRQGSPLKMSGEFQGKRFEDHGEVRTAVPQRQLAFTHFSGSQEVRGNLIDIRLEPEGERTRVALSQTPLDGARPDETTIAQFRKNWAMMLDKLKHAVKERSSAAA